MDIPRANSEEEGVLDDEVFDAPVPRLPFIVLKGEVAKPHRTSRWMYHTRSLARGNQGQKATTPSPERLPWAPGCGPSPEEGSGEKGKGKRRQESEASNTSSDDSMDLDEVASVPVATNVVVVDGVDDALGAIGFKALARDVLHRNGVRPLAIVCTRAQIWLRMADTASGQRALGGLRSLGPELQLSYRLNNNFDKEMAYTMDMWLSSTGSREGLGEISMPNLRIATAPEGATAIEAQAPNPSPTHKVPATSLEDTLADLLVDPDVLGTFLATMAVPGHLLLRVSPSPSPPHEVLIPSP
ncbi:hypothetical protein DFH08DRAFT_968838 [Mycena albidolilacea]|uniref:Uncharacterized protein n=1 Tax=Mycena albidolilacea TaxID=1033008 RepID=A0AAD6ZI45_9AGAR|nr:hypothetical protein DFH08DRAFT_968838 [Mycena albidolilacea]